MTLSKNKESCVVFYVCVQRHRRNQIKKDSCDEKKNFTQERLGPSRMDPRGHPDDNEPHWSQFQHETSLPEIKIDGQIRKRTSQGLGANVVRKFC